MEDFGYKKEKDGLNLSGASKKIFLAIAMALSLGCFIYITVNAYYFVYEDDGADIQTIESPEEPIKIIAGNRQINGENLVKIDRSIYDDIFGSKKNRRQAKAKIKNAPSPAHPPKRLSDNNKKIVEKAFPKKDKKNIIIYSKNKQKNTEDLLTKGEKKSNKTTRKVRVQVAAMTSKESAVQMWKRIHRFNPEIFANLKPVIEKVDLKKRGIFYRLQIGNFFNQIEAERFCEKYIEKNQKTKADCIVVE